MNDFARRALSYAIFGFGVLVGIPGCIFFPMAAFAAGANDSQPEIWSLYLMFGTPLPLCLLAFWKRFAAGICLTGVGIFNVFAVVYQHHYITSVRGFHDRPSAWSDLIGSFLIYLPFLALGSFALITNFLKWPKLTDFSWDSPDI